MRQVSLVVAVAVLGLTGCGPAGEGTDAGVSDAGTAATDGGGSGTDGGSSGTDGGSSGTTSLTADVGMMSAAFRDLAGSPNVDSAAVNSKAASGTSSSGAGGVRYTEFTVHNAGETGTIKVGVYGDVTQGKTFTCNGAETDGSAVVIVTELVGGNYRYWNCSSGAVNVSFVQLDTTMHIDNLVSFTASNATMVVSSGISNQTAVGTFTLDVAGNKVSTMGLR